ncbi:hypothetical protein D3C75_1356670 [compost metagenome]
MQAQHRLQLRVATQSVIEVHGTAARQEVDLPHAQTRQALHDVVRYTDSLCQLEFPLETGA